MRSSFTRLTPSAALSVLISGCALTASPPTVQEIKYNPGRYNDRKVAIDGVVTSSWGLPLVPFKLYKVDDGTGEVTVLSQGGRTPTRGAHVASPGASAKSRRSAVPVSVSTSRSPTSTSGGNATVKR